MHITIPKHICWVLLGEFPYVGPLRELVNARQPKCPDDGGKALTKSPPGVRLKSLYQPSGPRQSGHAGQDSSINTSMVFLATVTTLNH